MIDDPAYLKGLAKGRLDAMKELGDMMARLPVEVKAAKSGDEAFALLAIAWSELGLWGQSAALEAGEELVLLSVGAPKVVQRPFFTEITRTHSFGRGLRIRPLHFRR